MSALTTPEEARQFIAATGVDVLAPAVGNMHGLLQSMMQGRAEKRLNVPRVAQLKESTGVFMTLHGGSGTNDEDVRNAIRAGITIIHINTGLRGALRRGLEAALAAQSNGVAPYKILPGAFEGVIIKMSSARNCSCSLLRGRELSRRSASNHGGSDSWVMDVAGMQAITTAAAPVVMVSAAGLLFIGIQTKNLHLSDRVRTLLAEYRTLSSSPAHAARRQQIEVQLALFSRRIRLSQRSLESLYLAILCFVLTALLLAIVGWVGERMTVLAVGPIFVVGVALVVLSLALEFREMRLGLQTIDLELKGAGDGGATAG